MKQKYKLGDKVKLTRLGRIFLDEADFTAHIGMEMTIVDVKFVEEDSMYIYKTNYLKDFADFEMEIV